MSMDLDDVQRQVVLDLNNRKSPASQRMIRESIGCPKSTLSNKLRQLEDNGFVVDESGFSDNSKKYVLDDSVSVSTGYDLDRFGDTQVLVMFVELIVFAGLIVSLVHFLHVKYTFAYIMYGSFLIGVLPIALTHLVQKLRAGEIYSIDISRD